MLLKYLSSVGMPIHIDQVSSGLLAITSSLIMKAKIEGEKNVY